MGAGREGLILPFVLWWNFEHPLISIRHLVRHKWMTLGRVDQTCAKLLIFLFFFYGSILNRNSSGARILCRTGWLSVAILLSSICMQGICIAQRYTRRLFHPLWYTQQEPCCLKDRCLTARQICAERAAMWPTQTWVEVARPANFDSCAVVHTLDRYPTKFKVLCRLHCLQHHLKFCWVGAFDTFCVYRQEHLQCERRADTP